MATHQSSVAPTPFAAPRRLAAALTDYSVDEICGRLDCTEATARLLFRAAIPRRTGWLVSIRSIARALAVDPADLSLLLAEALYERPGHTPARRAAGDGP